MAKTLLGTVDSLPVEVEQFVSATDNVVLHKKLGNRAQDRYAPLSGLVNTAPELMSRVTSELALDPVRPMYFAVGTAAGDTKVRWNVRAVDDEGNEDMDLGLDGAARKGATSVPGVTQLTHLVVRTCDSFSRSVDRHSKRSQELIDSTFNSSMEMLQHVRDSQQMSGETQIELHKLAMAESLASSLLPLVAAKFGVTLPPRTSDDVSSAGDSVDACDTADAPAANDDAPDELATVTRLRKGLLSKLGDASDSMPQDLMARLRSAATIANMQTLAHDVMLAYAAGRIKLSPEQIQRVLPAVLKISQLT